MEFKDADKNGSFEAWGDGFNFRYYSDSKALDILSTHDRSPLYNTYLKRTVPEDAKIFVTNIDKATQIYALMLSGNKTTNLNTVFSGERLAGILKSAAQLANYSFDLQNLEFGRFADSFCETFKLKKMEIEKVDGRRAEQNFFVTRLKTRMNNDVSATAPTLYAAIYDLSRKTMHDLIMAEYESMNQKSAHNLLTVSSNLATISRILNERYSPYQTIQKYQNLAMDEIQEKA